MTEDLQTQQSPLEPEVQPSKKAVRLKCTNCGAVIEYIQSRRNMICPECATRSFYKLQGAPVRLKAR